MYEMPQRSKGKGNIKLNLILKFIFMLLNKMYFIHNA